MFRYFNETKNCVVICGFSIYLMDVFFMNIIDKGFDDFALISWFENVVCQVLAFNITIER